MKSDLHPDNYRDVVFEDLNSGKKFIVKSCATAKDTTTVDGVKMPHIKIHVSSDSHPFYTGDVKLVDTEGRVDSFKRRSESSKAMKERMQKKAAKARKMREDKAQNQKDDQKIEPTQAKTAKSNPKPKTEKTAEKAPASESTSEKPTQASE